MLSRSLHSFIGLLLLIVIIMIGAGRVEHALPQTHRTPNSTAASKAHTSPSLSTAALASHHHGLDKHKLPHKTRGHHSVYKSIALPDHLAFSPKFDTRERMVVLFGQPYAYRYFREINPPPPKAC